MLRHRPARYDANVENGTQGEGTTMIKDIVASLSVGGSRDVATDYAVSLAELLGAHVAGVAFAYEPVIPGTIMGAVPAEVFEASRAESQKAAKAATARFDESAGRAGISFESRVFDATLVGGSELFGRIARRFDLSVVGQAEPDRLAGEDLIIEAALFHSGRPVVVVPYIHKGGVKLDRVLVCWDGSRSAARAIGDAVPLLARSNAAEILIIATDREKKDEIPGADMGQHLSRHASNVDVKRLVATDTDVPNTILSYAADYAADFIVMGGYGHSRLREFILGGATRGILQSMTVPVLMSH
jgi:nucleotide-binding universal stress UspA family protein